MQTRNWNGILGQFVMVGQLGLSLLMPLLLCLLFCLYLVTRFGAGLWIYIPGFFFGLGGSAMTAYKVYKSVTNKSRRQGKLHPRSKNEVSFNQHF